MKTNNNLKFVTSDKNEMEYETWTIKELFDEIMEMQLGDMWDGMMSKGIKIKQEAALNVFGRKMKSLGVEWD